MTTISGQWVDIRNRRIVPAKFTIENTKITRIEELDEAPNHFILPGFVDAHVHVESSMLMPSEFARMAVVHGTVATISDPHEIANVCGVAGVHWMLENARQVPFHFNFGAPSCVPATTFETAGSTVTVNEIKELLSMPEIRYLSEMMNFPGVLHKDPEVMAKIDAAHAVGKPVDGHAPGLRGDLAAQYIAAGISTDHECFTADEALDKLKLGMKIQIREGSAAKNFEALIPLLHDYADQMMFCSDDKHPDSLELNHLNALCARAVAHGVDVFKVLQAACLNPVAHYKLDSGTLQIGDSADFIVVEDLTQFKVLQTYIRGQLVAERGQSFIPRISATPINNFACEPIELGQLKVNAPAHPFQIQVIEALDGQLITNALYLDPKVVAGEIVPDTDRDILKLVVVNRYNPAPVAVAFIHNFNLKYGAMASTVAHDSHNIIAVGTNDTDLVAAINALVACKGGVSVSAQGQTDVLPLPVAGLMTTEDGYKVSKLYTALDLKTKALGSTLQAPFMTLSFMALLVIPHLKLSDLGLFDGGRFVFTDVCIEEGKPAAS